MCASSRALLHVGSLSLWDRQPSAAPPFPSGPCVPPGTPYQNTLGAVPQDHLAAKLRQDTNDAKHRPCSAADTLSRCLRRIICGVIANRQQKATTEKHVRPCQTKVPSFNKDTHAFRQRKSALTASSSLTYASMPASSSLSSSGFPSPKSPAEFLRGRNGARGSAER